MGPGAGLRVVLNGKYRFGSMPNTRYGRVVQVDVSHLDFFRSLGHDRTAFLTYLLKKPGHNCCCEPAYVLADSGEAIPCESAYLFILVRLVLVWGLNVNTNLESHPSNPSH